MTGQMKKYRDSLEKTPEPVLLSQMQAEGKLNMEERRCTHVKT